MKFITLIFPFLFIYAYASAQSQHYSFLGALSLKGDRTYSYSLDFTDSNGIIKGYSITDLKGKDETKTAITGTVNTSKKEIRFNETYLIYTKSAANKDSLCYVHTKLKIAERKGTKLLKGSFTGYQKGGKTECARGTITMVASEDLLNKLMKVVDTLDSTKKAALMAKIKEMNGVKEEEKPKEHIPVFPDIIYLSAGNNYELPCPEKNITMELWDNEKIDGDVISINLDNKVLLDHYSLVSEHKTLSISLSAGKPANLVLIANTEGSEPPNTVRLKITSGSKTYLVQASTTLGAGVQVVLKPE